MGLSEIRRVVSDPSGRPRTLDVSYFHMCSQEQTSARHQKLCQTTDVSHSRTKGRRRTAVRFFNTMALRGVLVLDECVQIHSVEVSMPQFSLRFLSPRSNARRMRTHAMETERTPPPLTEGNPRATTYNLGNGQRPKWPSV